MDEGHSLFDRGGESQSSVGDRCASQSRSPGRLAVGALNLTATSGSLTLSGLGASSINTGANNLTITAGNFNTTATGINGTAIGATTPATGAFTTLAADALTLNNAVNQLTLGAPGATTTISAAAQAAARCARAGCGG